MARHWCEYQCEYDTDRKLVEADIEEYHVIVDYLFGDSELPDTVNPWWKEFKRRGIHMEMPRCTWDDKYHQYNVCPKGYGTDEPFVYPIKLTNAIAGDGSVEYFGYGPTLHFGYSGRAHVFSEIEDFLHHEIGARFATNIEDVDLNTWDGTVEIIDLYDDDECDIDPELRGALLSDGLFPYYFFIRDDLEVALLKLKDGRTVNIHGYEGVAVIDPETRINHAW